MPDSQSQRSGSHSNQVQVLGDMVIQQGVTEERAAQIARLVSVEVLEGYSRDAQDIAKARIEELGERLIPLLAIGDRLGAFADPAFQVALRHAQIGAASSERESDYDLLASLLDDHAARADVRPVRAGIRRAIEVVDQLDTTALRALTVHTAMVWYLPSSGDIGAGLAVMEDLYSDLIGDTPLPTDTSWIDHLDVLDAVRINTVTSFRKYREMLPSRVPGYLTIGLVEGSEELKVAIERLHAQGLPDVPIPHELKPGYVRFAVANEASTLMQQENRFGEDRANAIDEVLRTEFKVNEVDPELTDVFMARVSSTCPHFAAAIEWWDVITPYFQATSVGRVLARANASRLYSGALPPID